MILLLLQLSASEYSIIFFPLESSIFFVFGICKCSCLPSSAEALAVEPCSSCLHNQIWGMLHCNFLVSGAKFNDLRRSFLLHMPFFPDFSVYRIGRGCTAAVLLALPDVRHVASHSFGQLVSFFCPRKSRNQWLSRLLLPLTCPSSSISQFSASLLLQLNHDALVALPDVRHVASHAIGQLNFSFRPGKA